MKKNKIRKYKIINIYPIYKSEEEKEEAHKQLAIELALEAKYLREIYPEQKF